jgi:hypothetical protein
MFRKFFIKLAQNQRISMYETIEFEINKNLMSGEWDLAGLGMGVRNAFDEVLKHARSGLYISAIPSPYEIDACMSFELEGAALNAASLGKYIGSKGRVMGGQLVASIYGLRALSESEFETVSTKAKNKLLTKLDLANRALEALRLEIQEDHKNLIK